MLSLGQDLYLAIRAITARPVFAATIACTLGAAIGSNTAAFAIINGVLLSPLPVRDQGSLVALEATNNVRSGSYSVIPSGAIRDFRLYASHFAGIAAIQSRGAQPFAARDRDKLIPLRLTLVTADLFELLGVRPVLGRLLQDQDDEPGAVRVVVLSYHSWLDQFGGDSAVIGRTIELMGTAQRIVGVAPRRLYYPKGTDAWTSLTQAERQFEVPSSVDRGFPCTLIGRLRRGSTPRQAVSDFARFINNNTSLQRVGVTRWRVITTPFADLIVGSARRTIVVLMAAVTLVVVIACVNVASLFLSRALERRKELAVRFALGATRSRIFRQLATENALHVIASGVVGLAIAAVLLHGARAFAPQDIAWLLDVPLDGAVIMFAGSLTIVLMTVLAIAPAADAARVNFDAAIRAGDRSAIGDRFTNSLRQWIVVGEVAMAVLVLCGTTLLWRSQEAIEHLTLQFAPQQLLFVGLQLTAPVGRDESARVALRARYAALIANLRQRLTELPAVMGVTLASALPFEGASDGEVSIAPAGGSPNAATSLQADYVEAPSDYFHTLGIRITDGRSFPAIEARSRATEAVVNRALADRLWPGGSPIGKTVKINPADTGSPVLTVVGVVADAHYANLLTGQPTVYVPIQPDGDWPAYLVIRTVGAAAHIQTDVRDAINQSDPGYGIRQMETGGTLLRRQVAQSRSLTSVLLALSAVAMLLVATGVFAIITDFVRQRSRELAIRVAAGATPLRITVTVARHAGRIVVIGLILGATLSIGASGALRAMLYAVGPYDIPTLVVTVTSIVIVAALATTLPLWRVLHSDVSAQLKPE